LPFVFNKRPLINYPFGNTSDYRFFDKKCPATGLFSLRNASFLRRSKRKVGKIDFLK